MTGIVDKRVVDACGSSSQDHGKMAIPEKSGSSKEQVAELEPGEVRVTVYYQASQHTRTFKQFEAVKDVLTWAIEVFKIDANLATEFELTRHGQKEELTGREQVGHLVGKNCELELDLVRGIMPNANCSAIIDPSVAHVVADLEEGDFLRGCNAGRWRIIANEFPILDFAISATEPDGTASEYGFRAELSNYPSQAPMVQIWDHEKNAPLAVDRRPKGGPRVEKTFQKWGKDTVYRPWDRMTGPHANIVVTFPDFAWHPERRLVFIFEDIYGILNSNARAQRLRSSA